MTASKRNNILYLDYYLKDMEFFFYILHSLLNIKEDPIVLRKQVTNALKSDQQVHL